MRRSQPSSAGPVGLSSKSALRLIILFQAEGSVCQESLSMYDEMSRNLRARAGLSDQQVLEIFEVN